MSDAYVREHCTRRLLQARHRRDGRTTKQSSCLLLQCEHGSRHRTGCAIGVLPLARAAGGGVEAQHRGLETSSPWEERDEWVYESEGDIGCRTVEKGW